MQSGALENTSQSTTASTTTAMARVIADDDQGYVVRLCYGDTIPPRRAYLRVDSEGNISEMELAEVRKYGERPWR